MIITREQLHMIASRIRNVYCIGNMAECLVVVKDVIDQLGIEVVDDEGDEKGE